LRTQNCRWPVCSCFIFALALAAWLLAGRAADAAESRDLAKELRQAQSHQHAKRYRECLDACDKLLAACKDPMQAKEIAWLKAETQVLDGQLDAALKTLADFAKACEDDRKLQAAAAVRTGDIQLLLKKPDDALATYQRLICTYPLEQTACQAAQAKIVEVCRAASKWAEALGAARVLYDAAGTEQGILEAAQTVAQAFLAVDGNLGRANEFLAYQSFGPEGPDGKPNTADDIAANRLAEVRYPTLGPEVAKQFGAAIQAQPENYDGFRAKAFLYAYSGRAKEAAAQFRLAFKVASLTQLPTAAQELVLIGLKAHTASFHGLDRAFEFLNYGPKGKSGKESLPDPFAGL